MNLRKEPSKIKGGLQDIFMNKYYNRRHATGNIYLVTYVQQNDD
jgi:hypothetical protein